jgi:hypothetical protein
MDTGGRLFGGVLTVYIPDLAAMLYGDGTDSALDYLLPGAHGAWALVSTSHHARR